MKNSYGGSWPQTPREAVRVYSAHSANMSEWCFVRVQQYKLMVKYRPGDQLHIADTLSRASQMESTSQADEFEVHLLLGI